MKKFLVLYMAPWAEMQKMMKEMQSKPSSNDGMEDWKKWMDTHMSSMKDPGAPLGKTKRLDQSGVSDSKNDIGGYSIMEGESAEAVAAMLKDNPHLTWMPQAWMEIIEIMPMSM